MTTARDILRSKGSQIWSVGPEANVFDALRLMADKNIGALLVTSPNGIEGILSERDYARKIALLGRSSVETPVSQIMTKEVITIGPARKADEMMAIMSERRVRHLPVVEGTEILGIISIGDVVKSIISEQKDVIQHLERYISGTPLPEGDNPASLNYHPQN